MSKPLRILGIAGSLRRQSYNRAALRAATQLAPEGATIETFELDGIPGFSEDDEQNPPDKVVELKRRIETSAPSSATGRITTFTRLPSSRRASTVGLDSSIRRPTRLAIRRTISSKCWSS